MTRLLVSVRSADEARLAVAGGADIIDVKEPLRGSLAAADAAVLRAVRDEVGGRRPLSAALGELCERQWCDGAASELLSDCLAGYQYAKLGLAQCAARRDWTTRWRGALSALPQPVSAIAVAYADWRTCRAPAPDDVLRIGAELGCAGLLIDTFDKCAGDLFHWLSQTQLAALVEAAHCAGRFVALAGSLTLHSIPRAIETRADVIAVRGAVCSETRVSSVDESRLRHVARRVKRSPAPWR